ncbi:hypothetical protein HOY80DRAFT_639519 [Tuber brumale]|nr:hypothetical protein HOY80DRAFT_639519 [Tuber brumale]
MLSRLQLLIHGRIMSTSAKHTQETVPSKRPKPSLKTGSKKRTKSIQSTGPKRSTLPSFFDKHPQDWGIVAYLKHDHGDLSSDQALDGWRKSLEFVVDPSNKQSELRRSRASELLALYTQGVRSFPFPFFLLLMSRRLSTQLPLHTNNTLMLQLNLLTVCNGSCVYKRQDITFLLYISFRQCVLATAGSVDLFAPHPGNIAGEDG